MKKLLLLPIVLIAVITKAQFTLIPDVNFEQKLISLGYDSGPPNGVVPTNNIDNIFTLDVSNSNITDLTGFQDFVGTGSLNCQYNQLTSLDVTQNTALFSLICSYNQILSLDVTQNPNISTLNCNNNQLTTLDISNNLSLQNLRFAYNQISQIDVTLHPVLTSIECQGNQLTALDVTQNPLLFSLWCYNNQISALDVTQNPLLFYLTAHINQITSLDVTQNLQLGNIWVSNNLLTSLDLSQNASVTDFRCSNNQIASLDISQMVNLTDFWCVNNDMYCLNANNGNNPNITDFQTWGNPNLTCIQVDTVSYSAANWTDIDSASSFSTNCPPCTVGIDELPTSSVSIYPNPTSGLLTISLKKGTASSVTIRNNLGQILLLDNSLTTDQLELDISSYLAGIYFLQIETEGQLVTKKVVKE
jgi:Secretion system C-terminal sorting domain